MKKPTKAQINKATKKAIKNLKPLDGVTINALNAMADEFKPLKEKE